MELSFSIWENVKRYKSADPKIKFETVFCNFWKYGTCLPWIGLAKCSTSGNIWYFLFYNLVYFLFWSICYFLKVLKWNLKLSFAIFENMGHFCRCGLGWQSVHPSGNIWYFLFFVLSIFRIFYFAISYNLAIWRNVESLVLLLKTFLRIIKVHFLCFWHGCGIDWKSKIGKSNFLIFYILFGLNFEHQGKVAEKNVKSMVF